MLGPTDPRRQALAEAMADAWVAVARDAVALWQPRPDVVDRDASARPTMVFDLDSDERDDPWGERRLVWMDG